MIKGTPGVGGNHDTFGRRSLIVVPLLVVALALGLNNFGAAIAIGVSGVDRLTGLKVAAVFGL